MDFCLGPALEREGGEDNTVWPMFVLWGDGAVYSVLCHQREDWSVEGPLAMVPEGEDNYREEASSICVIGSSSGQEVAHFCTALVFHDSTRIYRQSFFSTVADPTGTENLTRLRIRFFFVIFK